MSNELTPLQRLCLDHYCDGDFKQLASMQQVYEAGDSLLTYLMLEAACMSGPHDMAGALDRAVGELRHLQWKLEGEQ